jgi:S1-C subfamily serine protease
MEPKVSPLNIVSRIAGEREAGSACPGCHGKILFDDPIMVCQACGSIHHQACWTAGNGCGSYTCAPAHRDWDTKPAAPLKISVEDLAEAKPLAAAPRFVAPPIAPPLPSKPTKGKTNRLAIAALVCGILGIPLFGVLTGLVAVVLGSLAVGALRHTHQKGTGLAVSGILLGLGDMIGWIVFLTIVLSGPGTHFQIEPFVLDPAALQNLDAKLQRAMRANVLIETRRGFLSQGIGSGIILKIADGTALVLTNRHVVDPDFAAGDNLDKLTLDVRMVDQSVQPGRVVWIAPDGIDLALVRVHSSSREAWAAKWRLGRQLRVGDPVFAIGNPHGLGWTHTQGTISQFRLRDSNGRQLRIIQTQTAINPGNSGGGLYDQEGYLVGVNTWTQDKRVGEGLNFALTLDTLAGMSLPGLDLQAGGVD